MCEVVGEALEGITGEKFGSSKESGKNGGKKTTRKRKI